MDIESDSQLVCQASQANEEYFSSYGGIIGDCRLMLAEIHNATMTLVKRSANSDAHSVARASFSMSGCTVWRDVTPLFLKDGLDDDLKE